MWEGKFPFQKTEANGFLINFSLPHISIYLWILKKVEFSIFIQMCVCLLSEEYETTLCDFVDQSQLANIAWGVNMHKQQSKYTHTKKRENAIYSQE